MWFLPAAGAAVLVLILLGISLLAAAVAWNVAGQGPRVRHSITITNLVSLQKAIISHQVATGSYPATLNQLVPTYAASIPLDGWKRPFIYAPTPGGPKPFDLRSAGPDGIAGTPDDI